jgi:hypothetical protein
MTWPRRWLARCAACLLLAAAGCTTASDDLSDLARAFSPKSPLQAAMMAADPSDADQRRQGIVLLGNAPFGGAAPYLKLYREYAASDADPLVRASALRALGRHGTPEDATILAGNLTHADPTVRAAAAAGLQRLHNPQVVPALVAVLLNESEDPGIRAAVARGLGQYPDHRAFQALVTGVDAWELSVNLAARASLATLTGQDLGLDAAAWFDWYEQTARAGDPFAGGREYLYPTFQREPTLFERLAFWSTRTYEQPAPPAGLRPASERRTYDDTAPGGG